jgi:hypothetical protein
MSSSFYEPDELIADTGLSPGTFYRNLEPRGPIPCVRIGRRCLIPKDRWAKFVENGGRIPVQPVNPGAQNAA